MERLTTNKNVSEMNMIELAHNSCYAEGGRARYRDYDLDIDAREMTRKLLENLADGDDSFIDDEDFDQWMVYYLQDYMNNIEGLLALLYRNLWAMADLRERLKYYEDLEEQGLLLKLPCKVGDRVYVILPHDSHFTVAQINKIEIKPTIYGKMQCFIEPVERRGCLYRYFEGDFGKTVFFTSAAAEEALRRTEVRNETD